MQFAKTVKDVRSGDVSIPQAVGTIAIDRRPYAVELAKLVSIPQAVGTIAIAGGLLTEGPLRGSFNTASGRYYCNVVIMIGMFIWWLTVSIPQAVGTIAIN